MTQSTKTLEPHAAKCAWCEKDFMIIERSALAALRAGKSVYCSDKCGSAMWNFRGRSRHLLGPCPTCGQMFRSSSKRKIYCCMICYTSSDDLQKRLRESNENKMSEPRSCPQCGVAFQHKSKKYCSDICRRRYFAERFDRWVANPEKLALPQNFDEFLCRDTLPCIIEGCDWVGETLGTHVNIAHGITADEFRKLAGFNKKTGLVGEKLKAWMSENFKQMIADGVIINDLSVFASIDRSKQHHKPSLEAKEHQIKARALLKGTDPSKHALPCLWCGGDVLQPFMGKTLYCSTICRAKYYQQKGRAELSCDYCGEKFIGERSQVLRAQRNQKVCCSLDCRNKMNAAALLASKRVELSKG